MAKRRNDEDMARKRKAVADPLRQRLLERFHTDREWTAKELADEVGVGANGLYYHLRILEEAGFIKVVGSRAVGRMAERVYRGANVSQRVTWDINDPIDLVLHFGALLDGAKSDVADAVYETARIRQEGKNLDRTLAMVESPSITTTPDEIVEFQSRITALLKEFRDRARELRGDDETTPDGWKTLKFTYALRERPLPAPAATPTATATR